MVDRAEDNVVHVDERQVVGRRAAGIVPRSQGVDVVGRGFERHPDIRRIVNKDQVVGDNPAARLRDIPARADAEIRARRQRHVAGKIDDAVLGLDLVHKVRAGRRDGVKRDPGVVAFEIDDLIGAQRHAAGEAVRVRPVDGDIAGGVES